MRSCVFARIVRALCVCACLFVGVAAQAQPKLFPNVEGLPVDRVVLQGNHRNPDEDLLYYIKQTEGTILSFDLVSDDVKRLYKMKLYDDIQVDVDLVDGKVVLTYKFVEKPSIATIVFEGNSAIAAKDIEEKVDLKIASPVDLDKIQVNAKKIKALYEEKGYFLAEVHGDVEKREDGDVDVVFRIQEYDKVKIRRVTILGNEALTDEDIKNHIMTREASLLGALTGAGEYKEEEFKRDLQRIPAWYSENGYPDARVVETQVQLSEDRSSMYVTFGVEEGNYTTIGNIDFSGEIEDEEALRSLISIQNGDGFSLSKLFEDVKSIQDYYGDRGYAFAQVEPRRHPGEAPNTMDILFDVHPGKPVFIGKIMISGNVKTEDKVIRREILIHEGQLYHGSNVRASEAQIQRTGYFDKVTLTTQESKEADTIDILVEVSERSTGQFQIGAGFSSAESFIGTLQISYDNFLGRGHFLSAQGTISKLRQLFNIQFFDPHFIDSDWRFRASIFDYEYVYTDFTRKSLGGSIGFGYPFTRDLVLDLTYSLENVEVETNSFGGKQRDLGSILTGGLTSSVNATLTWDRRNNRLLPTKGFMLQGSIDVADEYLGSENEYIRFLGRARAYYPIFWDIVLKFNLEVGYIANWNAPNREVPIFERFFVGGPNSVRGFKRSSLGPKRSFTSSTVDPSSIMTAFEIGGNKEIVFNAEMEIPIVKAMNISGVIFFDMGNAFNEDQDLSLKLDWFADSEEEYDSMMRSAMGFGFRWMSPMGLLRFEWGFPFMPKKSEDSVVFEFSIGNAF